MRTLFLFLAAAAGGLAPAQDLRRGLVEADAVLVGRQVGKTPHGEQVVLHRVQILRPIRGVDGKDAVTVLDWPQLSLHQRPTLRQSRLYCLADASAVAARLALPAEQGPYYKMVAWAGSNPLVGADPAADACVQFAELLARGEAGARGTDTAAELCRLALAGAPVVRTEAARYLIERADLRTHLTPTQWGQVLVRVGGETDDVPHKIALAELCAEQRLDGLLDALVVSLGPVADPEYARTVGRIGSHLHGDAVTATFTRRLQSTNDLAMRRALLLAMGASNTESALATLLSLRQNDLADAAVEAALQEHRSPRAREAVAKKK
jgi:hypothetical protein